MWPTLASGKVCDRHLLNALDYGNDRHKSTVYLHSTLEELWIQQLEAIKMVKSEKKIDAYKKYQIINVFELRKR